MCGITGVLNIEDKEPINQHDLKAANDTIHHRGPDDEGMYVESDFGMAVRRLSIIDLRGGHQPISSKCGRYHIGYNGEIYNYKSLRQELIALGHQFHTNSDTEVVLQAYMRWGAEDCLARLRGMFAFAIWDSHSKTLFLARDRMGIKPLYFAEYNGSLYFSSEIRGILLCSNMPRRINLGALETFMTVGFVTAPFTLFQAIQKIPPAHYLIVQNGRISIHKYWELNYQVTLTYTEKDFIEQFRELLTESVKLHLMSEVPLGALLSGGIDSTTNVALMQKTNAGQIKTISIAFKNAAYDESEQAAAAATALGTEHYCITFTDNSLDDYPKSLYYLEEPIADATCTALYYLFEACRKQNLKVVLSGEGADELLGGYSWHRWEHWVHRFIGLPHCARRGLAMFLSLYTRGEGGMRMACVLRNNTSHIQHRFQEYLSIGAAALRNCLFSPDVRSSLECDDKQSISTSWNDHLLSVRNAATFDQMLWLQSRTRLVDYINHCVDRMSMAHSIEARPPFLDHKLWEFCATVPSGLKLGGSFIKPIEKYLLRKAAQGLVPETVRRRRKRGLEVPYASWLAQSRLPDWAEEALTERQLKKTGCFDPAFVLRLRQEHKNGAPGRATLLMAILAIQTWIHLFLERTPESGLPILGNSQ